MSFPEAYCEFSHLAVFSGHERAQKAIPAHRGPSGELLLEWRGLEDLLLLKNGLFENFPKLGVSESKRLGVSKGQGRGGGGRGDKHTRKTQRTYSTQPEGCQPKGVTRRRLGPGI